LFCTIPRSSASLGLGRMRDWHEVRNRDDVTDRGGALPEPQIRVSIIQQVMLLEKAMTTASEAIPTETSASALCETPSTCEFEL